MNREAVIRSIEAEKLIVIVRGIPHEAAALASTRGVVRIHEYTG